MHIYNELQSFPHFIGFSFLIGSYRASELHKNLLVKEKFFIILKLLHLNVFSLAYFKGY